MNEPTPYLEVEVWDAGGRNLTVASLPTDVAAGRLVAKLVGELDLPSTGIDNQPIFYKLNHRRSGRQLLDSDTLAGIGAEPGDAFRLLPEILAA